MNENEYNILGNNPQGEMSVLLRILLQREETVKKVSELIEDE